MPHIIKGSARYASIAGYNIYPALLLLPAFVVVLSNLLTRSATDGSWKVYFKYLAFFLSFCCIMMIVLLHPDTGMFVFCNCLLLLALFICGRHDKKAMSLFWIIFAIFASLMIFTFFTMPHVHHRIMNFFTGQGDIFQVSMAKKAMLNASLVGGSVKSIMFIPDGHTDFALASIVGYFGYIFTAFLLTVFWFVARKVLQHAKQAKDLFTKNFMTIVACMFIFQTLLHISVNLGLVPTFSTALPLVSFGGTSKLVYALLFGSVLALTRHQESEPVKVKRVVKKKK